jgi:transcriptional regulator with XRE-family HTH domain
MSLNPIDARLFRQRLVSLRKARGFNQDELSEKIGRADNYIMRVETGRIKTVPWETLGKIAETLDVFVDDLIFIRGLDDSCEALREKILRLTDTDDINKLRKFYRLLLVATEE